MMICCVCARRQRQTNRFKNIFAANATRVDLFDAGDAPNAFALIHLLPPPPPALKPPPPPALKPPPV